MILLDMLKNKLTNVLQILSTHWSNLPVAMKGSYQSLITHQKQTCRIPQQDRSRRPKKIEKKDSILHIKILQSINLTF